MIKNNKGLTMVSLLATIAIILILSFITISVIIGDKGSVNKAESVKAQSEIEDIKEKVYLSAIKNIDENGKIDTTKMLEELKEQGVKNISTDSADKIKFNYKDEDYEVDLKSIKDTTAGEYYSSTPNAPYLMSGMEPIKWIKDENGNDVEVTTSENDKEWYNYDKQLWANAKTVEDGSYWVWIPRYEYKITYYTDATKTMQLEDISLFKPTTNKDLLYVTIDINFIPKEKKIPTPGYKIHPAFTDGTDNYFDNGEWDKEVSGIWVSKYTISCEEYVNNKWNLKRTQDAEGNIPISNTIRAVSKKRSAATDIWRRITIGMAYENSYNYDREKESHLIKNSEYGALIYLTYSRYGTNERKFKVGENYTTNNITGIFVRSGEQFMTASYLADGNEHKSFTGYEKIFLQDKYNMKRDTKSTKYVTRYPASEENTSIDNYEIYQQYKDSRYGDAIEETSYIYNNNIIRNITVDGQNFPSSYPYANDNNEFKIINRHIYQYFRAFGGQGTAVGMSYNIVLIGE